MKYPLNWFHSFCRETTCFFLGHNWKHSPRQKTQYYDMAGEDVPYAFRKSTGNYMWTQVAWWLAKCPRCRHKVRPDSEVRHTWYNRQYWAIRAAFGTFFWQLSDEFEGTGSGNPIPWHLKPLQLIMAVLIAVMQYFMHFESLPWTWWTWLADIEYWWYGKLEGE